MTTQQHIETLEAGTIIASKYVVERRLGEGGFATVYLARHREIASLRFAIKVLHAEHNFDSRVRGRFRKEAETVAALNSRNIVRVVDMGELDGERPWIAMEFIEGRPLDELLKTCGRLQGTDVARLCIDVLRGLEVAHAQGVIHRDLKPGNVFAVQEPGEPVAAKVLDFGIAKVVTEAGGTAFGAGTHTVAGNIVCTPQYAAPELLTGKTSPLVDLYALGHMMAELLEGQAPYARLQNPLLIAAEHLRPEPVPLGQHVMASGLAPIVARACAKPEAERYSSAREMLDALREVLPTLVAAGPALQLATPYRMSATAAAASASAQPDPTTVFARPPGPTAHTPTVGNLSGAWAPVGEAPAQTLLDVPATRRMAWLPFAVAAAVLLCAALGLFLLLRPPAASSPTPVAAPVVTPAVTPAPEAIAPASATLPVPAAAAPTLGSAAPPTLAAPTAPSTPATVTPAPSAPEAPARTAPQVVAPTPAAPTAPVPQPVTPEATAPAPERPASSPPRPRPTRPSARRPSQAEPSPAPAATPAPTPTPDTNNNPFGNIELRR
ncbi:MAG: protein kinase [Myxococcales bacterium]|nr:protein kinase [Myxococcales bacterium]